MSIIPDISRRGLMAAAALSVAALAGCSAGTPAGSAGSGAAGGSAARADQTPETVTIQSLNAEGQTVDLEVPYDPERIAILDMASLDILDSIGVGDRVVGMADTSLEYLQDYAGNNQIANLGTIKEADLEAVMACEPDVIFIGERLSSVYDDLSEIAPVVYLATDSEKGVVESVRDNATTIASMFGLEGEVEGLMADFDDRIAELDPEYIFVLNRDAAIGADGAEQAQEVVENELTRQTQAYQNGNIVYLEHPAVWYTAEGGIEALNVMLQDLEDALLS